MRDAGIVDKRRTASGQTLLLAALALVIGYLILPPVFVLFYGAFTSTPPGAPPVFTTEVVTEGYGRSVIYPSLLNSLVFASATATLVLFVGGFLAWLVERTDSRLRGMTDLFTLVPILMPAVLLVSGWIMLLGPRSGMINMIGRDWFGLDGPVFDIYSMAGMIWIAMLQELPLAFLWLWPAFRSMNPALEEAGLMAGASRLQVLRRITLPLLMPSFLAAWIIFFIYSLGSLSVPLLVGLPAGIFLFSTEIYLATKKIPSDLNLASAYSLFFLAVTVIGLLAYRRYTRDMDRFVLVTGKGYAPRRMQLGRWQPVVTGFGVLLLLLIAGLPMLVIVWNAFMPYPQTPSPTSFALFTLDNFSRAWSYAPAKRAVMNSLVLGLAAGAITTAIGLVLAWYVVRVRRHARLIAMIEQLAMAPVAIPGMIIGVSLLWLYLTIPVPIYGTVWILLIAYVTLHVPFALRICVSGLTQIHRELEEAAYMSGADWLLVMRRILFFLLLPALSSAFLYVMLRSFREYTASIFLSSAGSEVFSVLVLDMWEGGNSNILAAYVTTVLAGLAAALLVFHLVSRRFAPFR